MTLKTDTIVFLFPPGGQTRRFRHHLGVPYIQAYLAKHGFSSRQLIPQSGQSLPACVDDILAIGAPIVGLTSYVSNYHLVRAFAERIKKLSAAEQYGIRVSPSEFLLPYDTQIPYPVLDVPPLANACP